MSVSKMLKLRRELRILLIRIRMQGQKEGLTLNWFGWCWHLYQIWAIYSEIFPVYSRVFEWWIFLLYSVEVARVPVALPAAGTGARTVGPAVQYIFYFIIHLNKQNVIRKKEGYRNFIGHIFFLIASKMYG